SVGNGHEFGEVQPAGIALTLRTQRNTIGCRPRQQTRAVPMKCDNCNNPATVHLTEIKSGKKIEKHLCEQCAAQNEGLPVKSHMPINELLTNFVMAHSGLTQKEAGSACEHCGITWAEFRQSGLLGCQHDYSQFEKDLTPLLQ